MPTNEIDVGYILTTGEGNTHYRHCHIYFYETTDATATTVTVDSFGAPSYGGPAIIYFRAEAMAINSSQSAAASWGKQLVIRLNSAETAAPKVVAAYDIYPSVKDSGAQTWQFHLNSSGNDFLLVGWTYQGQASTTIDWIIKQEMLVYYGIG